MDLVFHKLVGASQQFSCQYNHRRRPIAHFLVLLLRQLDQNTTGWMVNLQELENCCAIIRDHYITDVVHEHSFHGK